MKRVVVFLFFMTSIVCQLKSQVEIIDGAKIRSDSNLAFTGTRITERDDEYDSTGSFQLSGYVSTYYAAYSDTAGSDGYQKFPTVAPVKESFGMIMAMFSVKYTSERFRGITSFHFGDIPRSAWSSTFNAIQEANLGFKITKGLWLDAGFFRTHIGLESIQPRENIALSIAVATYFEPYFMSGAKLTYTGFEKLTFQLNAFNSFNGFVETNNNKALGASMVYDPNDKLSWTLNFITSDESPEADGTHQRYYVNSYVTYRYRHWSFGVDGNLASQKNSAMIDTTAEAQMFSAVVAAKYAFYRTFALYARVSYFKDRDEMLTGPIENDNHQLVGLDLLGTTLGIEFKPIRNSYLRLEGRLLQTSENEKIFYPFNNNAYQRMEVLTGLGVWF